MGLDIYLYPRAAAEANKRHYAIWEEDEDGNYLAKSMTDEERKAHDEAHPYVRQEDVASERYPEHYFNRRYLRSSYNSGGFNRVVPQSLGSEHGDLYWIFDPMGRDWRNGEDDAPVVVDDIPRLRECRERAQSVADALAKADAFAAITVTHNAIAGIAQVSDDQAVARYREEAQRESSFGWYSNLHGEFFRQDPPTILAAIPGVDAIGAPGVHLIYRRTDLDWYQQAAEIVAEFCDEAIALIERDGWCQISWSG